MPYADINEQRACVRRSYHKHKERHRAEAAAWRKANPEKAKAWFTLHARELAIKRIKREYKVTIQEAEILYERRKVESCEVCDKRYDKMHIDHNHKTNQVRGILCFPCNYATGMLRDSAEKAEKIAVYLRKYDLA